MILNENRYPHLAALEEFEDDLRIAYAQTGGTYLRPRPDLLHAIEPEGETYISASPITGITPVEDEPNPICMLFVTAVLRDRPRLTDEQINVCNSYTALSHLAKYNGNQVMAATAVSIFDDPKQRKQSMFVALHSAFLQRTWLSQVLAGVEHDFRNPVKQIDPASGAQSSRWDHQEIEGLFKQVSAWGFKCRVAEPSMLVIALASPNGGSGFIFLRNDLSHPFYGNGLSVTLVMPEENDRSRTELEACAIQFNERDSLSVTRAPFIGAWSVRLGKSQLQHQTFIPNVIYVPGLARVILEAALQRWSGDSLLKLS